MTQQLDNQPQSQAESASQSPGPSTAPPAVPPALPAAIHLPSATVRSLVLQLTQAEDILRDLEPFVVRNGRLVVNPARQPWIARERALVAELRSRRTAWRRGELPGLVLTPRKPTP